MEKESYKKEKPNFKACGICLAVIDLDKEHYAEVVEYKEKQLIGRGFYHVKCYRERLASHQEANKLLNRASEMFNKIGL